MGRLAEPDKQAASATPGASQNSRRTSEINGSQSLSQYHASRRSPSPFEASTTPRSRNNSGNPSSTRHGELYNATPGLKVGPPHLTVSSADTSDEEEEITDEEEEITDEEEEITDEEEEITGEEEEITDEEEEITGEEEEITDEEEEITAEFRKLDFTQHTDNSGSGLSSYSMRDEPLPAEPYYRQNFQTALNQGRQLARQVATCVEMSVDEPDSSLRKLSQEALTLSKYKPPTTRTIGIIGKSGSGKSSLINSLLDVNELALTGSGGTAVTAFVTEYRQQPTQDGPKFTAVAYCLNEAEIDENLAELLEDFYKPCLTDREEWIRDELKQAVDRSDAVQTIFQTAFGRFEDFHIDRDAHEEGSYERELERLKRWARQLKWPTGTSDGKWEASAPTEQKLHKKMEPFLSRGLWPFVKRVVIYLRSSVLKNGLVLADLPGYHDVSYARVAAARKFQSTCDEIFVVTDIKRGVGDPIIKEVIQELSSAEGVGKTTRPNITVVCSHAGDLGTHQDKQKLMQKVPAGKMKHAENRIDKLKKRVGTYTKGMQVMTEANMSIDELLIRARNKEVKVNLQAKYSDSFSPEQMPVFCIDNTLYQKQDLPLAVKVSGIPDLKAYCLSLPGRALFRSAHTFLESSLPALINSLDIWLYAAHNAGTESLSNIIDVKQLRDVLDSMLDSWKAGFSRICKDSLIDPCKRKEADILANASETCASWDKMYHLSYIAWVRKEGTHSTKTVKSKCWNTELVANLNHVLVPYWVSFDSAAETGLGDVSDQMQGHFEKFQKAAKDAGAPKSLVQNLTARQRLVETVFADGVEGFMRSFRLIKQNATTGSRTSYVLSYMHPVYKVGGRDSGTGVTGRNKERIRQHVVNAEFVTSQSRRIREDLQRLAERTVDSLSKKVRDILDGTARDLETIEAPDVALLEKYPAFGRSVEEMLSTARVELESIDAAARDAREEARRRDYI